MRREEFEQEQRESEAKDKGAAAQHMRDQQAKLAQVAMVCATLAQDVAKGLQSPAPVVSQNAIAPALNVIAPASNAIAPAQNAIASAQPAIAPAQNAIAPAQPAIAPAQPAIAPAQPAVLAAISASYKRKANTLTASPLRRRKDLASTKATKRRRVHAACAASTVA